MTTAAGRPDSSEPQPLEPSRARPPGAWMYLGAVCVPALIFAVAALVTWHDAVEQAMARAERTAEALREHARRVLRNQELVLDLLQTSTAGKSWAELGRSKELVGLLDAISHEQADIASVHFASATGTGSVSNTGIYPQAQAYRQEYFKRVAAGERTVITEPYVGLASGKRVFSMARRRTTAAGAFDGAIVVATAPAYFETFYGEVVENSGDSVALLRADGAVLVRGPASANAPTRVPDDSMFMRMVKDAPGEGIYTAVAPTDGAERVFAYKRVDPYPVYVIYGLSRSGALASWRAAMLPFALTCALAAVLLALALRTVRRRTFEAHESTLRWAEESARRAAAESARSQAEEGLRRRDRFIATLSHELRNPLAALAGSVEVLRLRAERDFKLKEPVDVAKRQVGRLRRLLDDLLDSARISHGKIELAPEPLELHTFLEAHVAARRAGPGPVIHIEGPVTWVSADPVRLEQIVGNLLDNAQKYGARSVMLRIARAADGCAEVRCIDDGEGIDAGTLPRIFEPFVQGESAGGGLGLGLPVARGLMALHGGSLEAFSHGQGHGATFVLRFPRALEEVRANAA